MLPKSNLPPPTTSPPPSSSPPHTYPPSSIRAKNRRNRYLDTHPEYFSPSLELADPLLYDRLIRRFQTVSERESEGRAKGYSGILEADLLRSEAKLDALAHPDPNATFAYRRGPNGEILAEEEGEVPRDKEEGRKRWEYEMRKRFVRGADGDFDYKRVDEGEEFDDWGEEERGALEEWLEGEEPRWVDEEGKEKRELEGETGIQDF
ncbi:MAG: hypothetical protein Q9227_008401 [Pyrenula ochraceoflavens]